MATTIIVHIYIANLSKMCNVKQYIMYYVMFI